MKQETPAETAARRARQAAISKAVAEMSPEDQEKYHETIYQIVCVLIREAELEAQSASEQEAA